MTEETKAVEPKATKYVRPKYVVGLYKSGMTKMEDLIEAVRNMENSVILRKNVKHPRDTFFYKRNIHWALSDATKAGEITGYVIKLRKVNTAVNKKEAPVNNVETSTDSIPTI
jgi:hypothetical protein